ncbi:MAG: bifunctional glycosyltransferase family 2/GtrA family protein [Oscillospiraceae bacterium]|nr:bifunctional glycosyltransferase family 2/GtrA family protein [Oscillospiraceae bacterium]
MADSIYALIPAYEPEPVLLEVAGQLAASGFSVLVVDDGSGAAYRDVFSSLAPLAEVLSYAENRGKGYALKLGLSHLLAYAPADSTVVTLDADGQHTVSDAWKVARRAQAEPDALVLGVRGFGKGTPLRSKFGNTVTRTVYRLSTGVRVSDTQTGLRAFSAAQIPTLLQIPGERYEYEMNMLLQSPQLGIPMREEPIETIYLSGNQSSHFRTIRDSYLVYGKFFKFAASSLTGFLVDYGLYSILVVALNGLGTAVSVPVSNVTARIVSAATNFTINKRLVFRNQDSALKTGAQYFLVAACILLGNTLLLSALVNLLGWNRFAAKLLTELTFFTLSFLAQRFWIFRTPKEAG